VDGRVVSSDVVCAHHVTRLNMYELLHIINKLNEYLLNLLGFHAYINEMRDSGNKIPSKNSRQAALRGGI
jgi:hypothetical protein